ncbi:MAG TPA: response regulator [Anaeromyxobacteraceae bacterium]|nr:response regulator [Anaeromyxobacteraceae bacterium]
MPSGRILLVEDDAAIREGVAETLAFEGYQAEGVRNGREALEWLEREGPPSLVVLDLFMPVMNGAQLLAMLHADPRWSGVPAVLMSAALPAPDALPPADAYLQKPFDLDELVSTVARWCPPAGGGPGPGQSAGPEAQR